MQHRALTLVVAALLAFGASGVVAATTTVSPSPVTADASPTDGVSPADHTVKVIDPDDRLSEQDIENAWQLAWSNETVKRSFENADSPHFQVEAVSDELQVYVATDETARPQVVADVDLDSESVTAVEPIHDVLIAGEVGSMQLVPTNTTTKPDVEETLHATVVEGNETLAPGMSFTVTCASEQSKTTTNNTATNNFTSGTVYYVFNATEE
ncbi:hypothetical protein C499_06230 [Halogeometricum borinquense DSM 11551]|uniref:Uncharacterized protein n=1 Tax=Halogeometricum borinquense (strain ATCC 700274 / DSM 11551 / JCM 10706 / KCTC 4070 / PR3) TaxID=469382 RepID=E4NV77_HALBP|nr:hypothetical protein [Halogeometricum borinquense]ADQ69066.1 hypothetical protein Hbor_35460 [Halogeometricum borinquense DSM 11551]ELY29433.1 hypothetical protein C499_06230 [Halogeometricum borinquense DSM 11551]